jgi:hypothetical protein
MRSESEKEKALAELIERAKTSGLLSKEPDYEFLKRISQDWQKETPKTPDDSISTEEWFMDALRDL